MSPGDSVWDVLAAMFRTSSEFALVASHDGSNAHPLSSNNVKGFISRDVLMDTLAGDMELFGV